jgi:hypothetical protein
MDLGSGVDVDWIMVEPQRMKRWSQVIKDKNQRIKELEREPEETLEEKKNITAPTGPKLPTNTGAPAAATIPKKTLQRNDIRGIDNAPVPA